MASIKGSFDLQTVKVQTPSFCLQLRCCGKSAVLFMGEIMGTRSGSRSLRMVPDNHGRNRNPFTFEISTFPLHLSIYSLTCTHLIDSILGTSPRPDPNPPVLFLALGGWGHCSANTSRAKASDPAMHGCHLLGDAPLRSAAPKLAGPQWAQGGH